MSSHYRYSSQRRPSFCIRIIFQSRKYSSGTDSASPAVGIQWSGRSGLGLTNVCQYTIDWKCRQIEPSALENFPGKFPLVITMLIPTSLVPSVPQGHGSHSAGTQCWYPQCWYTVLVPTVLVHSAGTHSAGTHISGALSAPRPW